MDSLHARRRKILVVDDEPKIVEVVKSFLESRGFAVFGAENTERAFEVLEEEDVALILLDLMLPGMTGEEFCGAVRKKSRVPIIMLTAKVEEENMLKGFSVGADDYITKPFSLKALLARIEAVLRRSGEYLPGNRLTFNDGELEIDFEARSFCKNGQITTPTPNEFKILEVLVKNSNRVFTREQLIDAAIGGDFDGFPRAIDGHVKNLRRKIEDDPKKPVYILTMHGVGYKFGGRQKSQPLNPREPMSG
ncbi:MAG: response regulator transcription factor [Synergistaceae bacterium]|jgi:DNA-binding response OmpR family regulator|nr:response regulator transcription factor [Synergistaceae bacterium]